MYKKGSVGLEEAMGAIQAMLKEITDHPEKYWQHGAMAVVDERGKLVSFAKMDSSHQVPGDVTIRKAWTAAVCAQNNDQVKIMLEKGGVTLEEFCAGGTSIAGGLAIFDLDDEKPKHDSDSIIPPFKPSCIGAVAVGGVGLPQVDADVAKVGLDYIRGKIWPNKVK